MQMSHFEVDTGKVEAVVCHKQRPKHYLVTLETRSSRRNVGELFGSYKDGWSVVSHAQGEALRGLRLVRGFRTKWQAIEYLLDVGIRKPDPDFFGWPDRARSGGS